jgi:hypothetical protein
MGAAEFDRLKHRERQRHRRRDQRRQHRRRQGAAGVAEPGRGLRRAV